ncbi:hypothetical protein HanIR_Chr02g0069761 [Helianthus annuus]|nr:hypothetical protein HanIR_Chr02g0069761 [Helianthus annuus]
MKFPFNLTEITQVKRSKKKSTMPSFHFILVAVTFVVPSSRNVKVLVSLVSSKYGLGPKF